MKLPAFVERLFLPARKEYGSPGLMQVYRDGATGDSPRMNQDNIATYLGRYADEAWVFACINIIQSKGAGVPLNVYRKVGSELTELPDHPLKKLLDSVNPFMDGYGLREATHGFVELAGNSYWLLDVFVNGKPTEVYPLSPQYVQPKINKTIGVVGYEYRIGGVLIDTYAPEEILHFKTWNPLDPFVGQPRLSAGRTSADTMKAADEYNKNFFKNGAAPGGFLTTDLPVEEDQQKRILEAWKKAHQGYRKAHNVAIMGGGLKWQNNASTQSEMMFPELKTMSREDVLTCFGVPSIMVGLSDGVNYANAEEQRRIFWIDSMIPRLKKIESVINERLAKAFDATVIVKHDLSGIEELAQDEYRRAQSNSLNVAAGVMTINEVRKKMKLPDVEWGDTWYAPFGLAPVTLPGEEPAPAAPAVPPATPPKPGTPTDGTDGEKAKARQTRQDAPGAAQPAEPPLPLVDVQTERRDATWARYKDATETWEKHWAGPVRALFNDQEKEVMHNLQESGWTKTLNQSKLDGHKNIKTHVDAILFDRTTARRAWQRDGKRLMEFTVGAAAEKEIRDYDLGIDFNIKDHNVVAWLNTKSFKFSDEVNRTTEESLRQTLSDAIANGETLSQVEDRIAAVFDIARGSRTAMIARTEVISASNEGAYASYKQSGVVESKEWISSRDNKVRDTHQIDGEQVGLEADFSNGLKYPGDPDGDAEEVINCRCTLAPVVAKGE